eukprot:COSAG05_NODE_22752_length_262_cov_1.251534_1_plen_21_part_01
MSPILIVVHCHGRRHLKPSLP